MEHNLPPFPTRGKPRTGPEVHKKTEAKAVIEGTAGTPPVIAKWVVGGGQFLIHQDSTTIRMTIKQLDELIELRKTLGEDLSNG